MPHLSTASFNFLETTDDLSSQAAPVWEIGPLAGITGLVSWVWEVPTNTVLYSGEWRNILMRPEDAATQTTLSAWWPDVHEDDVKPFLEAARDIVEGVTENYQTLFRVQRGDDSWAWLLSRGRVVQKDGKRPLKVCGALMDVTFLRHDIKFQHGSAMMNAPTFHAMPSFPANASADDTSASDTQKAENMAQIPRRVNFQKARHLLLSGAEVFTDSGEASFSEATPEVRSHLQQRVRKVFSEGRASREMVTLATDYGHNVTGEYFFWPELDAEGRVVAVMTQFWDLTDIILAERRARLNEMRLDALYRLSQMSAASADEVMNFALESLVQLTESGNGFLFFPHPYSRFNGRMVWSRSFYDILDKKVLGDDALPEELANFLFGAGAGMQKPVMRNGNCLQPLEVLFGGKVRIMRYIAAPVFEDDRLVCIACVANKENTEYRDSDLQQLVSFINGAWLMLRRHEHIHEMRRAKEAAEKANKVKDEFLANVSHELRTPLNGILSMLQLLEFLPLDEQHREYVRTASSSGKALLRIISDILDFARIESGKLRLRIEPFDLKTAFEASLALFRSEAEERGLAFNSTIDEKIPGNLLGDDGRVRQIIFNVVGNALKFTEQGGINVECCLLPCASSDYVWVYLGIQDTGIGIPDSEQDRIFEAFTQIDSSATRKYKGTGLGLSIVSHLVNLMGGSITLESDVGVGTTVHCSLRFACPPAVIPIAEVGSAQAESTGLTPLRILVAEDDDVSRFAIKKLMQHLGYEPVCVSDGRMAVEMLQLLPFNCLFTDIQMPGMDGLELVKRIRESDPGDITPSAKTRELLNASIPGSYEKKLPLPSHIVAVTVSAHNMRGDKERFLEQGMDYFISKPVVMEELEEVLKKICERLSREGALEGAGECPEVGNQSKPQSGPQNDPQESPQ